MTALAARELERTAVAQPRHLPAWPLFVLFFGFPVWWILGLAAFATVLSAVPMLVLLVQLRRVELPPAFWLWIGFVVWAGMAAIELDSASRLIGFGVRSANYVGSGIVFLYIYNARERLTNHRAMYALIFFFGFVIAAGYMGVLIPQGSLSTPAEVLLPASIRTNEYVQTLVHPTFAEAQQPYGSPQTFYRPSAPFAYTNGWGCNVALLIPLMVSAFAAATRRRSRVVLAVLLVAAFVPAFATLNRGMFLAVGVVLFYGSVRLALRGRLAPLMIVLSGGVVGVAIALSSGVIDKLEQRLHYSQTNLGRQTIYREAFEGAVQSPIFGHGAPRPSETLNISIGTQGQLWNVMFSYGFIALAFFLGWFALAALQSAGARAVPDLWVHATLFIAFVTFFYYGYDGIQLTVTMTAAAIAYRNRRTEAEARAETTPGWPARPQRRASARVRRSGSQGADGSADGQPTAPPGLP